MLHRESYLQARGSCFSLGSFAISPAVEILPHLRNAVDSPSSTAPRQAHCPGEGGGKQAVFNQTGAGDLESLEAVEAPITPS